jgi:hypothetical protein
MLRCLAWLDERRKEHFAALTTWAQWFLQRPRTSPVELPPSGGGRGRRTQQSVQEVPEVVRRPVARGDVGSWRGPRYSFLHMLFIFLVMLAGACAMAPIGGATGLQPIGGAFRSGTHRGAG